MALPQIECVSCGETVTVGNRYAKARKYCKICQVVKDLSRFMPAARPCAVCEREFFPVRHGSSWNKCYDCASFVTLVQMKESPECNVCGRQRPPAEGLDATCLNCIQSHEHYRADYFNHLKKIVAKRKEIRLEESKSA